MRGVLLSLLLAFSLPISALAASYQKREGTIVDPILYTAAYGGGVHTYSGLDLEPFCNVHASDLSGAVLSDADLSYAFMQNVFLADANLTGADLSEVFAVGLVLTNANLTNAVLTDAVLLGVNLTGADLSGVRSGGISAIDLMLPPGWRLVSGHLIGPGVILVGANLSGTDLSFVDLNGGVLIDADLTGADLTGADVTGADFSLATYDEFTVFPSGNLWDNPSWGLDSEVEPWIAGMVPAPEPSFGLMMLFGAVCLAELASHRD